MYVVQHTTIIQEQARRSRRKKSGEVFLASCRIMSTLCRVYGDLDARALLGYVVGRVLFIRAYRCSVVWLQWASLHVCMYSMYVYLGGCIHQVSIIYPSLIYNITHTYTSPSPPSIHKVQYLGTYARPAYQPDDSPQTQERKAKQPKPATSRLPSRGSTATVNGLPNYCIQEN